MPQIVTFCYRTISFRENILCVHSKLEPNKQYNKFRTIKMSIRLVVFNKLQWDTLYTLVSLKLSFSIP